MPILPGSWLKCTSENEVCDECSRPAVEKMAGEVDSFGVEWQYYCTEHAEEQREKLEESPNTVDDCECCGHHGEVFPYRDPDEGFYGPVYWYCNGCRQKFQKSDMDSYVDDYPDDVEQDHP